jgi:hypothetical protein
MTDRPSPAHAHKSADRLGPPNAESSIFQYGLSMHHDGSNDGEENDRTNDLPLVHDLRPFGQPIRAHWTSTSYPDVVTRVAAVE